MPKCPGSEVSVHRFLLESKVARHILFTILASVRKSMNSSSLGKSPVVSMDRNLVGNLETRNRNLLPLLRLTPPTEGFPCDDLRKILLGGQRMAKVHSGEEMLPKGSTPTPSIGCINVTDRRQTDRRICDSNPNVT